MTQPDFPAAARRGIDAFWSSIEDNPRGRRLGNGTFWIDRTNGTIDVVDAGEAIDRAVVAGVTVALMHLFAGRPVEAPRGTIQVAPGPGAAGAYVIIWRSAGLPLFRLYHGTLDACRTVAAFLDARPAIRAAAIDNAIANMQVGELDAGGRVRIPDDTIAAAASRLVGSPQDAADGAGDAPAS